MDGTAAMSETASTMVDWNIAAGISFFVYCIASVYHAKRRQLEDVSVLWFLSELIHCVGAGIAGSLTIQHTIEVFVKELGR